MLLFGSFWVWSRQRHWQLFSISEFLPIPPFKWTFHFQPATSVSVLHHQPACFCWCCCCESVSTFLPSWMSDSNVLSLIVKRKVKKLKRLTFTRKSIDLVSQLVNCNTADLMINEAFHLLKVFFLYLLSVNKCAPLFPPTTNSFETTAWVTEDSPVSTDPSRRQQTAVMKCCKGSVLWRDHLSNQEHVYVFRPPRRRWTSWWQMLMTTTHSSTPCCQGTSPWRRSGVTLTLDRSR